MDQLLDRARTLAQAPYDNPDASVAENLRALTEDKWTKIAYRSEELLWKDENLPFVIGFHHPGFIFNRVVAVSILDHGVARPVVPSPDQFNYPNAEVKDAAVKAGIGYAGFFVRQPTAADREIDSREADEDLLTFLGASYFSARGRHSLRGAYARGLAIDTAQPNGEEFPYFREIWLEKPEPDAAALSLYALMDSPRMTGAFHFLVSPGTSTVMEVESTLFLRSGAAVPEKVGLAPLTSMFLHSETTGPRNGDYRPEVHSSDGLLLVGADNVWRWTPLGNPERLIINQYPMENPHGFGLLQRDDNFDHYQDLDARFDRHSSVWVEPVGDWGKGSVELVEIPGKEDYHRNMVAFWAPEAPQAAATNGQADPAAPFAALSYRLHWMTPGASPHDLGRAVATRMQANPADNTVRFYIDFEGERLNGLPADTGLASIVELPEHFSLVDKRLIKNTVTSGWRLVLTVRLLQKEGLLNSLFSSQTSGCARFTAQLKQGENLPEPLTETWVYNLLP